MPAISSTLLSSQCHPSPFLGVGKAPPKHINRGKSLIRKSSESRPSPSVISSHGGRGSVERVTWLCQKLRVKPKSSGWDRGGSGPALMPDQCLAERHALAQAWHCPALTPSAPLGHLQSQGRSCRQGDEPCSINNLPVSVFSVWRRATGKAPVCAGRGVPAQVPLSPPWWH